MVEEKQKEIERLIPVNILEDSKQMRITIPKEIVEDFHINPNRHKFAWVIEKEVNSNTVTIIGKFITKNAKK